MPPLAYRVVDRSILLPFYRRALIDPVLPHIPARVTPNAITHAGHLINLLGVGALLLWRPHRGPLFALSALTLQLHVWCDNADGGHARRTGQSSPRGEFLDHGLDTFNVVYIALLTCLALGVAPGWWVALSLIIPSAASVTFWEQSHTGTFHLGLLNQVESTVLLGCMLLAAAAWGDGFSARLHLGGVALRDALCVWTAVQIGVGALRSIARAVRAEAGAYASLAPLLAFDVGVAASFTSGALPAGAAVVVGAVGNVHFALRMLLRRLGGERPAPEASTLLAAVVLGLSSVLSAPWTRAHAGAVTLVAVAAHAVMIGRDLAEGLRRSDAAAVRRDLHG